MNYYNTEIEQSGEQSDSYVNFMNTITSIVINHFKWIIFNFKLADLPYL